MIESMKIISIPNPSFKKIKVRKQQQVIVFDEEIKIFDKAKLRQSSLNNLTNMTHYESKPPPLKVRQLPMKSIEFKLKHQEPGSSPPGIIKTRAVLSSSFNKKRDPTYITQEKHANDELHSSRQVLSGPAGRALSSYKHLTRIKYLLSNTRIPISEDRCCFAKSREDLESASRNFRINSYLRSLKART